MPRKLLFLMLLVPFPVLTSIATAQTIQPDIKKVVTFIFPADPQGDFLRDRNTHDPIPYGTGFFVGVQTEDKKYTYGYLVTAKHVLKDDKGNDFTRIYLRLNTMKEGAQFVALDLIQNGYRIVYTHSDPTVDIAVMASARGSGGSKCWGLCGFADQYAVGGRSCAGADAEQGIEGSMACSAPIEAEHELVEVMLEVCFPQSVIDAQTPALEV